MRFLAVAAALVAVVSAENFTVMVGQDGLTYTPPSVVAKAGDTVAFTFKPKNHTVTQSTFAKPCEFMSGGIDSGYFAVAQDATTFPQWSFTVTNDTAPLWFYCQQSGHCSKGMVFAVNPTQDKTFDAFKATAMGGATSATAASAAPSASNSTTPNGASIMSRNTVGILTGIAAAAGLLL